MKVLSRQNMGEKTLKMKVMGSHANPGHLTLRHSLILCHRGPSHLESWCKAKSLYNRWVNYFNVPGTTHKLEDCFVVERVPGPGPLWVPKTWFREKGCQ